MRSKSTGTELVRYLKVWKLRKPFQDPRKVRIFNNCMIDKWEYVSDSQSFRRHPPEYHNNDDDYPPRIFIDFPSPPLPPMSVSLKPLKNPNPGKNETYTHTDPQNPIPSHRERNPIPTTSTSTSTSSPQSPQTLSSLLRLIKDQGMTLRHPLTSHCEDWPTNPSDPRNRNTDKPTQEETKFSSLLYLKNLNIDPSATPGLECSMTMTANPFKKIHGTISKDNTAGEEVRRGMVLGEFGRRCRGMRGM